MAHRRNPVAAFLTFILGSVVGIAQPPDARSLESAVQKAIEKAEPAIVGVYVSRGDSPASIQEMAHPTFVPDYFGSGVLIDHRLVLTGYHVVRESSSIGIRLAPGKDSSQVYSAKIYAADSRTDLAVLQITDPRADTSGIVIGRGEALKKGSFVIALGQAYSVNGAAAATTASSGIISDLFLRSPGDPQETERVRLRRFFGTLAQVDARVRPGGSGGALVDLEGQLVGLLTSQVAASGDVGGHHAVVLDGGLRRVVEALRRGEEVEYGFLGVSRTGRGVRSDRGVRLTHVTPNSPAAAAGLTDDDTILSVDGQPVNSFDEMVNRIGLCLAGTTAVLEVRRWNQSTVEEIRVKLVKAYHSDFGIVTNRPPAQYGLRVDYASVLANLNNQSAIHPIPSGVVIREVQKASPAESAGLREYSDVIGAVNGVAVRDPAAFYREAKKAQDAGQPLQLRIVNRGEEITVKP